MTSRPRSSAEPQRASGRAATGAVIVKPVVNAIRVLRYLAQKGAPERAVDIARHLSINPSTCFNILRTLVVEDVVDFNPLTKTYSAGLGLAQLMEQLVRQGRNVELALPQMREVAAKFGVTVTLWRPMEADRIVLVQSVSSPTKVRVDMPAGQRLPILLGASGRLFASRMGWDDSELRAAFSEIRWERPLSFASYLREVKRAAKLGWAVDDGHFAAGVLAVAAPVCDPAGAISYTLSAVTIRGQQTKDEIEALGEAIARLGQQLQHVLI